MNIEIFDVREVGEGRYSISLRKSGMVSSYVLELSDDPILGLSGPESFWALVEADKEALQEVLSLLIEFHQTGSSTLPKQLLLKDKDSRLFEASLPWTSRSSVWHL